MEGKNVPRSEENFEQLQTSKIGKQGTYMLRKEKESELEDRIKVKKRDLDIDKSFLWCSSLLSPWTLCIQCRSRSYYNKHVV